MSHTRNHPSILALAAAAALALAAGCQQEHKDKPSTASGSSALPGQSAADLDTPIATIDDAVITVGEFQDRINRQSPYIRARYTSLEQKREFLDNLIRFEVLAGEAFKRGLDKDPDVVRTMKQVMIQKLMKSEFENRIKPEDITDADMKAFYEEHRDEYNKPEEDRVSAIILADAKTAAKVAKLAKGDKGKTNKGFRELVNKYPTDDKNMVRGGDPVLIASQGGINFFLGNNPGANGRAAIAPCGWSDIPDDFRRRHAGSIWDRELIWMSGRYLAAREAGRTDLEPSEVSPYWFGRTGAFLTVLPAPVPLLAGLWTITWFQKSRPDTHPHGKNRCQNRGSSLKGLNELPCPKCGEKI